MYFLACCRVYILQFIVGDYADRACWLWQMLCYSNDNYGAHEVYLWLVHGMSWICPRMWFRKGKGGREWGRKKGREREREHSTVILCICSPDERWYDSRLGCEGGSGYQREWLRGADSRGSQESLGCDRQVFALFMYNKALKSLFRHHAWSQPWNYSKRKLENPKFECIY